LFTFLVEEKLSPPYSFVCFTFPARQEKKLDSNVGSWAQIRCGKYFFFVLIGVANKDESSEYRIVFQAPSLTTKLFFSRTLSKRLWVLFLSDDEKRAPKNVMAS
jgi:hypothetical protein